MRRQELVETSEGSMIGTHLKQPFRGHANLGLHGYQFSVQFGLSGGKLVGDLDLVQSPDSAVWDTKRHR